MTDEPQALQNTRVVEVATSPAGAFCGRLLAMLGANVVKVEAPALGDATRRWGPYASDVPDDDHSLLFLNLNLNKRGVTLDVCSETGKSLLKRLLTDADVLVLEDDEHVFSDVDIAQLADGLPGLIVAVMRPFGMDGPYASYQAHGLNLFQAGGSGYLIPAGLSYELNPQGQPLDLAGQTSLEHCGIVAASAILTALYTAPQTGGQVIDCSKQEAHLAISRQQLTWYASDQLYEKRESYHTAFGGCLPCKDGFVEFYAVNEGEWRALKGMLDDPSWAEDERFKDGVARAANAEVIQPRLIEWAADHTREEIYRLAQKWGSPTAYFATPAEVSSSPQEFAREFFMPATHAVAGTLPYALSSFRLSETPVRVTRAAPRLGEHNREVYLETLGMSSDELTALSRMGVV